MKFRSFYAVTGCLLLSICSGCGQLSNPAAEVTEGVMEESFSSDSSDWQALGTLQKYCGVVASQKGQEIQKESDREISEVLVEQGDAVKKGEVLFRYNTEELQLKLSQAELELTGIANKITTLQTQIESLQKEHDKAAEAEKLSYILQIQQAQLDIQTEEYNTTVKQAEIDRLKKSLEQVDVCSEMDGVVQSINESGMDNYGNSLPYMKIVSTESYQIQAVINELNADQIYPGMEVTVYSRVDPSQTWSGTITSIDFNNPQSSQSNGGAVYYSDSSNPMQQSSKYYFYVELDSFENLMLGQHVYVEASNPEMNMDFSNELMNEEYPMESGVPVETDWNGELTDAAPQNREGGAGE